MRQHCLVRSALLFCLATLGTFSAAWAANHTVTISGTTFNPSTLNIQVGDTVTWVNNNQGFHNVTAADGSFRSGAPNNNFTFSHTFDAAGTVAYYCEPHRDFGMTGTIVVGDPEPCVASATVLCVNNGRFKVETDWRIPDGTTGKGQAVPIPGSPDSGLFYFFSQSNLEMLVKVLNGCSINNNYWVFYAATTNVELRTTITDTQTGRVKVYFNPLNTAAPPIQDTNAFPTCP